jgi:hypothetical protein
MLQKTMGHASITVTAHVYADLYDDELDDVGWQLPTCRVNSCRHDHARTRVLGLELPAGVVE